jgi:hypothetical protein
MLLINKICKYGKIGNIFVVGLAGCQCRETGDWRPERRKCSSEWGEWERRAGSEITTRPTKKSDININKHFSFYF